MPIGVCVIVAVNLYWTMILLHVRRVTVEYEVHSVADGQPGRCLMSYYKVY